MRRIHLVGRQNHGKTTLMVELVAELTRRKQKVGTFKHSGHDHVLDTPGKDSYRHKEAGATPSAVLTPTSLGLFMPHSQARPPYELLAPFYRDCDVVLVEGDIETSCVKIEVWRSEVGTPPLALERRDIFAVISDDDVQLPCPRWERSDLQKIVDEINVLTRTETCSCETSH